MSTAAMFGQPRPAIPRRATRSPSAHGDPGARAPQGQGVVFNNTGAPCVVDPDDPDPRGRLVTITGHVCRACGLPRVPYRGDGGTHPWCAELVGEEGRG